MPSTAYIGKVWHGTRKLAIGVMEVKSPNPASPGPAQNPLFLPYCPLNFLPFSRMLRMQTSLSA
jgi:hypothetical protein